MKRYAVVRESKDGKYIINSFHDSLPDGFDTMESVNIFGERVALYQLVFAAGRDNDAEGIRKAVKLASETERADREEG